MKDLNLINSCQAHLPMQYAPNIGFIRQKWHICCDWQLATPESHMQNKSLVCSNGYLCSHWLTACVPFFRLQSNKTVNMITY